LHKQEAVLDEKKLIRRMKNGDIKALEPFVQAYQEKAIRTAYLICQDAEVAKDAVQSVFISIYKQIGKFDESRPFAPYFFRSVANAAIKASQESQRKSPIDDDDFLDNAEEPETAIERLELTEEIEAALQRLSPQQRALIVLRYFMDYSEQEMAAALEVPKGTIKSRLYAARQILKAWLSTRKSLRWEEGS
jgi:RNA polymerase sigma-70 factor, ECF subfamily